MSNDNEEDWLYARTNYEVMFTSVSSGRMWEIPAGRVVKFRPDTGGYAGGYYVETLDGSMFTRTAGGLLTQMTPIETLIYSCRDLEPE